MPAAGPDPFEGGPLILGCDSMFLLDGECYGKPHSVSRARTAEAYERRHRRTVDRPLPYRLRVRPHGARRQPCHRAFLRIFSDLDIERYIATGEPLEVAGSFTLEGFGGAFIDGIEGDPHGIIGLSLPLVRRLAAQLGVDMDRPVERARADLRHGKQGRRPGQRSRAAQGERAPAGRRLDRLRLRAQALGYERRFRRAAGPPRRATGEVTHVVMQHRAVWSAEGGTWGIPGGATADGESPIEGALRECYEEANITPEDIDVVGSYCEDHGPWAYTTVFAFEKPGHTVEPKANDDESMEIEWVPIERARPQAADRHAHRLAAARLRALAAVR